MAVTHGSTQLLRVLALGTMVALMYWLLFANEARILDISRQGDWSGFLLIAIALVFSFVHGAFTSHFWELLGLRAKK
jgi:hypothetical protein